LTIMQVLLNSRFLQYSHNIGLILC